MAPLWNDVTDGISQAANSPADADVVICGGGAAGCIVAGRLADADPSLEILIIEQGPNNLNRPDVIRPAVYLSNIRPGSETAKFYHGRKAEHVANRSVIVPTGNVLGGGSSINFLMYTRASASDYDDWKTEGWYSRDLIPLLKKTETFHLHEDPAHPLPLNEDVHGLSGPLHVSYGNHRQHTLMNEFMDVAKDMGYPTNLDINDFTHSHGAQRWGKWIDPKTGRRQDTAHCFVHSSKGNIRLLCDTKVSRIVIEDGKAIGAEYVPYKVPEDGNFPAPKIVKARKLVILSSGSFGSPGVLERSGIGNPEILARAGIETLVDLPGVGSTYQDHNIITPAYRVVPGTDTQDGINRGDPDVLGQAAIDFEKGKGKFTSNAVDAVLKCRPNDRELEELGPAFRPVWDSYFKNAPDKPVLCIVPVNSLTSDYSVVDKDGAWLSMAQYPEYPSSRGEIHIVSSSPYVDPDFDPGYLREEADLRVMMWGYKLGREFARRMPSIQGEEVLFHPNFSADSKVGCVELNASEYSKSCSNEQSLTTGIMPVSLEPMENRAIAIPLGPSRVREIKGLEYSAEDDKAIEQYIRENIGTTWHALGTNPMKPREEGGVVDKNLDVYGVKNLKLIDLSICPGNVGANTYSTATAVGEKGAILAGEFLGLPNL